MKFSIFESVRSAQGTECTYEKFLEVTHDARLLEKLKAIAAETDADRRGEMKKGLPIITWQAYFAGKRVAKEAQPSGLFMLDVDHVEDPYTLYNDRICGRIAELGIVLVHKTPSGKGLRVVAKCRKEFETIGACQEWLAGEIGVAYDAVCKDWARSSFAVHDNYIYYLDGTLFVAEAEEGTVYKNGDESAEAEEKPIEKPAEEDESPDDSPASSERLDSYKGVPYGQIVKEWFYHTGGEPTEGERNVRLYQLALRLRYITDFNEVTMLRVMPTYGLPEKEVREIVRHSLSTARGQNLPKDLQETLDIIDKKAKIAGAEEEEIPEIITSTEKMPSLPPVFRQWAEVAPEDFKAAVVLCQLPILGALGSRLRAQYLDGRMHSPSFQVSLEAPQASGKSFLVRLVNYELAQMMAGDEAARRLERAYQEKMSAISKTKAKVKIDELPEKPKVIIRYLPATISITMLLKRMEEACGLHCFAFGEEIDTVNRAYKRGFSNLSEMLRVAFDNGLYGQDYASENSWSGNVALYYNTLFSGTPKAMRRFYPDVEDGLVSRVMFVTLPDQFGKPMPTWAEFDEKQKATVDRGLENLNNVTLAGGEVQPVHVMKMEWLNAALERWIKVQQVEAVRTGDRTRDIFCRRAAVVGFRAGMLAWFLWDEKGTPTIRKNVVGFATWVANSMLNQHLLRYEIQTNSSNTVPYAEAYAMVGDEFTRGELEQAMLATGVASSVSQVIYKWKLAGLLEVAKQAAAEKGRPKRDKFRKNK